MSLGSWVLGLDMVKNRIDEPDKKRPFPARLQAAVSAWQSYTRDMRDCRKRMLVHYANDWYQGGRKDARTPQPLNLIDRAVQIIAPFLVSKNPRAMIMPRMGLNNPNVASFSRTLELALAHLFDEIKFAENTLRPMVIQSLFGMGIVKTGIMHSHQVEILGHLHDVGQPYSDIIDFDDYIGDVAARNRQEMRLEGHKYRLPLWYIRDSGLYKNFDRLKPDLRLYGDDTRPETIAKDETALMEFRELYPSVEMMDIWIPMEDVVITIPPDGQGDKIMRTVDWDGPEGGPFDVLGYRYFPDSIIPIPPVYTWLDLNKIINQIICKMRDQCMREKTIGVYQTGADEDAKRLKDAGHGDMVGVATPESVKEFTFGGFNEQSFPFVGFLLSEFAKTGPNMDITGGKSVMAKTLGQEQMLQANAAREIDDMVHQMYETTKSIIKKLAWFLWTDPLIVLPLIKRVMGVDLQVEYSESAKEGDFFDYTFDIEPYSMMRMNPDVKYQKLSQFVTGYILPTAQIAAQQGTVLNVPELAKEFARYLNVTNMGDWYQSVMPAMQQPGMNPYQPGGGSPKVGMTDQRMPENQGSNMNNMLQQQNRVQGKTTAEL